ncbi:MAG: 3-oxoacid CoA-transferase [Firmicutes bacterium]|nr:3-oxoacid CoA-transferase [Candidatus Fermentithermobacillaceae bacterium]
MSEHVKKYNAMELMICLAARFLEDGKTVVVGTGAPCAAAMLAQKTHAPNLTVFFEAGGIAPLLPTMPISVGDSRTFHKAIMASSMIDVMDACQRGVVDYCFLGGAQIDMYGNINSTVIGDFMKPRVRLPGSGGANDLASLTWRTMVITPHDKRRFVPKVDFITSPGYLTGKGAREVAGLPPGTGPYKIITNLCVMGFDEETCRMRVESLHTGVTKEEVVAATGFELIWPEHVLASGEPTEEELEILRNEVDPMKYIIGREAV